MSTDAPGRGETFLSRWSRRKQAEPETRVREDACISEEVAEARGETAPPPAPAPQKIPADLPAIESLTPASDFSRFMRADVPAASRNAAVKKLFADPHFNVMDGLDIYIDDYTRADPIPLAMLKSLAQSHLLGLFDEPEKPVVAPRAEIAGTQGAAALENESEQKAGAAAPNHGSGESPAADAAPTGRLGQAGDEPRRA